MILVSAAKTGELGVRRCGWVVLVLLAGGGTVLAQRVYPADPPADIRAAIANLKAGEGGDTVRVNLAAMDAAAPYLRAEWVASDPLQRRRIRSVLDTIEARAYTRNLARAAAWGKNRRLDLFTEFVYDCANADAPRLADIVLGIQKDIGVQFSRACGFPQDVAFSRYAALNKIDFGHYSGKNLAFTTGHGSASFIRTDVCNLSTFTRDGIFLVSGSELNDLAKERGGDWNWCIVFVNNSTTAVPFGRCEYLLVVCDGDVELVNNPNVSRCVIVSNGSIIGKVAGPGAVTQSALFAAGDITLPAHTDTGDCLLHAGGSITLRKKAAPSELVKENQKTPPFGIRFLDPKDFGLDVAVQNGGTQVMGLTPESPFAKFGVADGDVIVTIDDVRADALPTFRRQLRKGILKESVTLGIRRGTQRITRIVFLDGVPEPARPLAPPPRELRK